MTSRNTTIDPADKLVELVAAIRQRLLDKGIIESESDKLFDQLTAAAREMDSDSARAELEDVLAGLEGAAPADAAVPPNDCDPPRIAESLLTVFATSSRAEAAIGDLNERFADECKKLGQRRAVRLYWARTLRSLWPLLRLAIGRALKWGAVVATVRRFFF